jgi:hypothetical protein
MAKQLTTQTHIDATEEPLVREAAKTKIGAFARLSDMLGKSDLGLSLAQTYLFVRAKNDSVVPVDDAIIAEKQSWTRVERDGLPLTRPFSLGGSTLEIPVGVTVLLGKAATGKTLLAYEHLFAQAVAGQICTAQYIRHREPGNDAYFSRVKDGNVKKAIFEQELALALAHNLLSEDGAELTIIDSLRYLFYSASGGATGKGGVNMTLFAALSDLDEVATSLQRRLIVIINPMSDDDTAFDAYVEAANGAVSAVIRMEDYRSLRMTSRYASTRNWINYQNFQSKLALTDYKAPTIAMRGGVDRTGSVAFHNR